MSAILLTCPRCSRAGFYAQGLKFHVCRGARPGDVRRRLTQNEIHTARLAALAAEPRVKIGGWNPREAVKGGAS